MPRGNLTRYEPCCTRSRTKQPHRPPWPEPQPFCVTRLPPLLQAVPAQRAAAASARVGGVEAPQPLPRPLLPLPLRLPLTLTPPSNAPALAARRPPTSTRRPLASSSARGPLSLPILPHRPTRSPGAPLSHSVPCLLSAKHRHYRCHTSSCSKLRRFLPPSTESRARPRHCRCSRPSSPPTEPGSGPRPAGPVLLLLHTW
mmetsp:Transcript_2167/g.5493  ORF Transcript_2167/g.5493 Transcript_2167/m.5493 type:complete len:200 (-) Transcript_2167:648-1247(-)